MAKSFISGAKGEKPRSDLRVKYTPSKKPLEITVQSIVEILFGQSITEQARSVCQDLQISTGAVEIEDFGALPFVIAARLEAA
ncbi:MAG: citrate lyase ACP, partial [Planctomycetia bacterium]|nr:citrate lyase ACP [Planctomycetia bacterium]